MSVADGAEWPKPAQAFWADVFARRDNAAMVAMAAVRALIQGWRWR